MANAHEDILKHPGLQDAMGKKAVAAINTVFKFVNCEHVDRMYFWKEDYDSICKALKDSGYRADGFRVGNIKAIRYQERN